MKRFIAFAVTIILSVFLIGCTSPVGSKSEKPNGLSKSFQSAVTVNIENLEAQGTISRFGVGMWQIEFSSPNTLSGVKLEFSDGSVNASYKGLNFSVPQSALPIKAMMMNLMAAVDDLAANPQLTGEEENGLLKISGALEGGDYTLSVDSEGNLSAFEMPCYELKIRFSDIVPIEAPQEETASESTLPSEASSETIPETETSENQ